MGTEKTNGSVKRTCATPDTKNHLKRKHPSDVARKYVEPYSSFNAAAQFPRGKGKTNLYLHYFMHPEL